MTNKSESEDYFEIKERLKEVLRIKGETVNSLSAKTGFEQRKLNRQINERTAVGFDVINLIIDRYPDIDAYWLITGKTKELIYGEVSDSYKEKYYEMLEQNNKILLELNEVRKENTRLLGEKGVASAPIARAAGEK